MSRGDREQPCDVGHEPDPLRNITDLVSDLCRKLVG
jgi:hypothetical protein